MTAASSLVDASAGQHSYIGVVSADPRCAPVVSVAARDRECLWPGCHAQARWCEVHHVDWWERDTGPTSIDNGALLCRFHHHEVHRRDLAITRLGVEASDGSHPRARPGFADAAGSVPGSDRAPRGAGPAAGGAALAVYELRDRAGQVIDEPSVRDLPLAGGPGSSTGLTGDGGEPDRLSEIDRLRQPRLPGLPRQPRLPGPPGVPGEPGLPNRSGQRRTGTSRRALRSSAVVP